MFLCDTGMVIIRKGALYDPPSVLHDMESEKKSVFDPASEIVDQEY